MKRVFGWPQLVAAVVVMLPMVGALSLAPPQKKEEIPKLVIQKDQDKFDAKSKGRGYVPLTPQRRAYFQALSKAKHGDYIEKAAKNLVLPVQFDGRTRVPLPMWDQGPCGSCYLVSTVRTLTSAGVLVGLGKPDGSYTLSVQYGMDNPRNFGGCDGGNGTEVIDWMVKNGWIAETYIDGAGKVHKDYPPYQASSGQDRTTAGAKVWAKGWTWGLVNNSGNPTTNEIKTALFLYGRLNVALDAGGQFGNGTGTITSLGNSIDHEINLVAWDDTKDGGAFLLENQWGTSWGVGGYRWVTYGAAKNLVDLFWISAGTVPPIPPDPPADGVPPFKLYKGQVPDLMQVGKLDGYATLVAAESDARVSANADKLPVLIYDASKPAVLVETVQPGKPPVPPVDGVFIVLTPDQIQSVLTQSGSLTITGTTTIQQIADQLRKNQGKEPPMK